MFLNNPSRIINVLPKETYTLYISDENECDRFDSGVNIAPNHEIIADGKVSTITEKLATILLPEPKTLNNLLTNTIGKTYKCFCAEDLGVDQMIGHLTSLNSWECLLNTMGNPEYVIIIRTMTHDIKTV